ncbi:MAG: hypothetical protein O2912_03540 [Proteobacteria bacterium]|nr:hypothetical protein [Pseudomonadota bacterium]
MHPNDIEHALWAFLVIIAVWIIFRLRRRAREADRSFRQMGSKMGRQTGRGIAHRMAGKRPPGGFLESAGGEDDDDEDEDEDDQAQPSARHDWIKDRRQFLLTFVALVLIVILSIVSCIRGGL